MLNKLIKKLKINQRSSNGSLLNVVQAFLNDIKYNTHSDSRFSCEDAKQLHLSLLIIGESKGAYNKWLFYNSDGEATSGEDVKAIAELCFGNFRLETQADASKVHLYKLKGKNSHPPSTGILLSRVCKGSGGRSKSDRKRNDTSQSSENDDNGDRSSGGLPVGSPGRNEGGSGSTRSSAYFSSTESIFSQSPGRAGSLPRETCPWLVNSVSRKSRVDLSIRRSMESFRWSQYMEVLEPSSEVRLSNDNQKSGVEKRRGSDLGYAVLFQAQDVDFARRFRAFFFANFGCIESRMVAMCDSLQQIVDVHTYTKCNGLCDGVFDKFKTEIQDLVFAPRLTRPIWLSLSSENGDSHDWLYDVFLHHCLLVALDHYNSKQFVTSLITAVLCHHLAWISTVEPVASVSSQHSHVLTKQSPDWQEHTPYNPHFAQMNDLYGLLGNPLRLSRTLVIGRDAEVIEFFLFLVSYFLRCSNVARRFEELPNCMHPKSLELLYETSEENSPTPSATTPACDIGATASCEAARTVTASPPSDGPKTSIDSGMVSTEDIQAFIRFIPDSPSERAQEASSDRRKISHNLLCPPKSESSMPTEEECKSKTRRMVCNVKYFEEKKAPYLDIPLLFGDLNPHCRPSNDSSSHEYDEEEETATSWYSEGHSLLAGVHSHSSSFFALQGTQDARYAEDLPGQLRDMLLNNGVNEDADEAVCVLVDTDRLSVSEYRLNRSESRPRQCTTTPAKCVSVMLAQVANLAKQQLSSDLCLRYLEDQLQGIYMNALAYAQVEAGGHVKALGYDKSDIPLLEAISSVHRPLVS